MRIIKLFLVAVCSSMVIGCVGNEKCYQGGEKMASIAGKKILFIIASNNFRDEEFFEPKQVVDAKGGVATIASSSQHISKGVCGATVKPDILLSEAKAADYDAIVFVGGAGSSEYWNDPVAHRIAKETFALGRVVSAICIAPITLANAGLLNGKKATVFSSEIERLKSKGALYTGAGVEIDGKIITANGPQSATLFGEAIVAALQR
ncbi:MAG: DJ-1/PfpI family protein [bacterium]|nr:DJ-1/PfpI family protein [bacterium]